MLCLELNEKRREIAMKRLYKPSLKQIIHQENGVTLVEILVAIVLLSIIVTTFLSFFIQAAKANNMTEHVTEATFMAQEEMELLVHLADNNELVAFEPKETSEEPFIIKKVSTKEGNLLQVIVTVSESKEGGKILAQMENWLPIKKTEE